jgi:homogentisate 1,2-dioxygenase
MSVQALKKSEGPIAETVPEANAGYLSGFGNGFETEALPGALPVGRNSPQKCPYGLYAEQLSGSPFTAPRTTNERSWLYRIRPTVNHWGEFEKVDIGLWRTAPAPEAEVPLAPMRWDPIAIPDEPRSLLDGIRTITTAGDAGSQAGMGCHVYLITRSMQDEYFYNADGEMLFVPQQEAFAYAPSSALSRSNPARLRLFRVGLRSGSSSSMGRLAATSAKTTEDRSLSPSAGLSVQIVSRISAISSRPSPHMRIRTWRPACS